MLKPLKLTPVCKSYIWGGTKLIDKWGKKTIEENIAESWELSCNKEGQSFVEGIPLNQILLHNPCFLGENCNKYIDFPILIKLIDSKSDLSIQVHPTDEYALANEKSYGKTEMWYIVEADEGSGVYCGFKKPFKNEEIEKHLNDGTICDVLNFIKVKAGDTLFINAGTVHAICGGLLICEVQQNSSLTYRLFDYNRKDSNGNLRQLHIKKSLDVINSSIICEVNKGVEKISDNYKLLANCKYFSTFLISGIEYTFMVNNSSFNSLNCLCDGILQYTGGEIIFKKGETYFLPAKLGKCRLIGENLRIIQTKVN